MACLRYVIVNNVRNGDNSDDNSNNNNNNNNNSNTAGEITLHVAQTVNTEQL
jgi:hypothetical protein